MSREIDAPVLVLNQNYEPLNVCNVKRALVLVFNGKAEVLELNHYRVLTASDGREALKQIFLRVPIAITTS